MENAGQTSPVHFAAGPARVRVLFSGHELADSDDVLVLKETGHPDVFYFPCKDVEMAVLQLNDHRTTCPWKGVASHFSLSRDGEVVENVAWSYEDPIPEAQLIAGRIAFYPRYVEFDVTPASYEETHRHVPAHDPPYAD